MQTPSATETTTLDQRARLEVPIHQWTLPDGTRRGVKIQALSFKQAMLAERAATDKEGKVNAWRLIAEENCAAIYDPPGLTVNHLLDWNADVNLYINQRVREASGYAAAVLAAELAKLADGPPPEPRPDRSAGDAGAGGVGGDADTEAWAADGDAGAADAGGSLE